MSKLEDKIKALLSDADIRDEVRDMRLEHGRQIDYEDGMRSARLQISTSYAERYGVTWEAFKTHLEAFYECGAEGEHTIVVGEFVFHKDGSAWCNIAGWCVNIEPITMILWGRYLEGLSNE